mgnify:FL=1
MTNVLDNRRSAERFRLETALVRVVVGAHGSTPETKGFFEGHAYDVSDSGLRLELDSALPVGTPVDVELHMPGLGSAIHLVGRVARVFDEIDDPGPRRMGMNLSGRTPADSERFTRLLGQAALGRLV